MAVIFIELLGSLSVTLVSLVLQCLDEESLLISRKLRGVTGRWRLGRASDILGLLTMTLLLMSLLS